MRTVVCAKYGEELEGFDKPPFPGAKGVRIFESVSKKAWGEWLQVQTRLINEKQLNPLDPSTQVYLDEQFGRFLSNESFDDAEHFVPVKK